MNVDSNELAIEVRGLVKKFPRQTGWRSLLRPGAKTTALNGVDLSVHRGETFGILGPNGAGKTTLIKILCTLVSPNAGFARVAGLDVAKDHKQVRQRIGLIYGDHRSFYWRLSLRENLRFYAVLYGLPSNLVQRRIDEMLDLVGLSDSADVRMHSFSSGMKQRAAIARGLLSDPEIVFLDEPTTSVDPIHSYEIRKVIKERVTNDKRRTVILTTNTMEEAEQLCNRLALIDHGRIVMTGGVSELRHRFQPDSVYRLRLSDVHEGVLERMRMIPGVIDLEITPAPDQFVDMQLTVARNAPLIPKVIHSLVQESVKVWWCYEQDLTLDEMFRLAFGAREPSLLAGGSPQPQLAGRTVQ